MMITPAFELSQDPDYLTLSIRVPYTRTSEFDLYIDGVDFKFYAKPYFLRLTLPGRIVEDGREKGTFDIDKGLFTLRVPKQTSGENFEGLQMLTSLLAPKGSRSAKPLVEDLSTEACGGNVEEEEEEEEEEDDFNWEVEQNVFTECSEEELLAQHRYGFGNQRSGVFTRLQEELCDVIDVKNPEGTSAVERRRARLEAEDAKFCSDSYLADLFEDDEIQGLLKFRPWWSKLKTDGSQGGEAAASFTDDEKEQLRKFTNRSYVLGKQSRQQAWLGLADLLLAYCYTLRTTEGEHTVESPWTIGKLCGTLSWLETYASLPEVLVSFGRRVLCYPLHRHFSLVTVSIRDTARIFQLGKVCVLKCLLDIHKVFRENDPAYILNDLYVTDYCIWVQQEKSRQVAALADALGVSSLRKKDLGLELEELETAARLVQAEEEEEDEQGRREATGGSGSAPKSRGVEESDSDDSSSSGSSSGSSSDDSSEESEDCEPEGKDHTSTLEGGGETAEANPLLQPQLQPQLASPALPAPASSSSLVPGEPRALRQPGALTPAPGSSSPAGSSPGCSRLIQELGEMVEEGLWVSQPHSSSGASHSTSRRQAGSPSPEAATETLLEVCEASQSPAVAQTATETLLDVCPRRNPLLIVQTDTNDEDIDEDDYIS